MLLFRNGRSLVLYRCSSLQYEISFNLIPLLLQNLKARAFVVKDAEHRLVVLSSKKYAAKETSHLKDSLFRDLISSFALSQEVAVSEHRNKHRA